MFVLTMDSESKTWVALGRTKEEAAEALLKEWNEAQKYLEENYGHEPDYYTSPVSLDWQYGVNVTELAPGECDSW